MKLKTTFKAAVLLAAFPLAGWAQFTTTHVPATGTDYGAKAGNLEVTLGGAGNSDKKFNNHSGGVSGSVGMYFSDALEGIVRQSVNYADSDATNSAWNASTFVAADYHFVPHGAIRPFVGANFGGIYGDGVRDTWGAGLEGGAKFYVRPQTFIVATVQYEWLFNKTRYIDNTFNNGQFLWSVGVGFNL
jgi:hypothetical protein